MNKTSIAILTLILLVAAAVYFFSQRNENEPLPLSSSVSDPTPSPEVDLARGGSSYLDEKGIFSILYPNDYILDTQDPVHVRIYKRGETQRPQSEMSDGALIVFESVDLKGATLESLVDSRIKESTADGTTTVVEAKRPTTQNTYEGFQYSLQGLGVAQYLVLRKDLDSQNAVIITYSISDPEQKGYQQEINQILSTLKILK